jgi:hypothetical protein
MNKVSLSIVLAAGLGLSTGRLQGQNLLTNGDFASGDFTGWNVTGYYTSIASYYDATSVYNPANWSYPWVSFGAPTPNFSATQFALLGTPNGGVNPITLSQTFATDVGQDYVVSFKAVGRTDRGRDYFKASIGATTFLNAGAYNDVGAGGLNSTEEWADYTYTYTATSTATQFKIECQNIDSAYGVGMVSVQAVPEPSTYGFVGVGALAVALVARRRKHAANR